MLRKPLSYALLFACALAVACAKDKTPPPPPNIDPVVSPTPQTSQTITGSAEYGAKIHVTGGAADVDTTADQFTARFRVSVQLKPNSTNTLSLTATDSAGNASSPAQVTITHAPPQVATLTVTPTVAQANAGTLVGLAVRATDQYGNPLASAPVTWSVSPALPAQFTIPGTNPAVTKPQGVLANTSQFVAYDLSGVKGAAYLFTITATSGAVTGSATVTVLPAAGYQFSALSWLPSGTTLSIAAGQDAPYSYQVVDLYGNPTTGPETAYSNVPGAIVLDDGVSGSGKLSRLTTTGSYTASFYIAGKGQQGALTLNVGNSPPATIALTASGSIVPPNQNMLVTANVKDTFGNAIVCSAPSDVAFSAKDSAGVSYAPVSVACAGSSFQATFNFAKQGNYSATATYAPGGVPSAVTATVFFNVLQFDTTPPTVAVQNIRINGFVCTPSANVPAGCTVQDGDFVSFDVSASDDTAIAEISFSALFSSTGFNPRQTVFVPSNTASTVVSFSFTVRTNAVETANLVASAVDQSGNRATSTGVKLYTTLGATPLGGRTLVALSSGGILNNPTDVVQTNAGDVLVANRGTNELLDIAPGANGMPAILATIINPQFIARGDVPGTNQETIYVTNTGDGSVYSILPNGSGYASYVNPNGGTARGLATLTPMSAKGYVDVATAAAGDTLTISQGTASTTYEFTTTATCTAGNTCVTIAAGATGAQKAAALVSAVGTNPLVSVQQYVPGTGASSIALLQAKVPGNNPPINLAKSATSTIILSSSSLVEGHFGDLYVASSGDVNVRRYQLNTNYTPATNGGAFSVTNPQYGLAVRDIWSPNTTNLQDLELYFVPTAGGLSTIQGQRVTTTSNGAVLSTTSSSTFSLTQTTDATPVTFGRIADLALRGNGCLLASDLQRGNIYAIDVTNAANASPSVTTIATGFTNPQGLALDRSGNLIIADSGANTIYRLAPNSLSGGCF